MSPEKAMNPELAETVALKALAWILSRDDLRGVFLGSTGASAEDFARAEIAPEILLAVLDFLCLDDAWLISFCDYESLDYTVPNAARAAFPGGAQHEWT